MIVERLAASVDMSSQRTVGDDQQQGCKHEEVSMSIECMSTVAILVASLTDDAAHFCNCLGTVIVPR